MKKKNIKIIRGDDVDISLRFTQEDSIAFDLTGYEINLHARDEEDEIALKLSTNDNTIIIADTNQAILRFAHDQTQDLPIEPLVYDLQLTKNGKRKTVLYGQIQLIVDQTRV